MLMRSPALWEDAGGAQMTVVWLGKQGQLITPKLSGVGVWRKAVVSAGRASEAGEKARCKAESPEGTQPSPPRGDMLY